MARHHPLPARLGLALLLGACQSDPAEVPGGSDGPTEGSSTGASPTTTSNTNTDPTSITSGSTGGGSITTSTGPGMVDSSGSATTTGGVEDSSSSSEGSTGEPSPIGCADGFRDALLDEMTYPNIAACAGGFWVPGVDLGTPLCDRQGGNDGPFPDGMGCSIDDLCAAGWHLCASRDEVSAAGMSDCTNVAWGTQFFVTAQSGEGANTCAATGTNDVFGCGDVGYTSIFRCAPLNRSTGNLCVELAGPWQCADDANDEVSFLSKPGPTHGGALCCRDGI